MKTLSWLSGLILAGLLLLPAHAERFPWTPPHQPIYREANKRQLNTYKEVDKRDFRYFNSTKRKEPEVKLYRDSSRKRKRPDFDSPRSSSRTLRFYDSSPNSKRGGGSVR